MPLLLARCDIACDAGACEHYFGIPGAAAMEPMPPLQLGSATWPVFPGAFAAQGSAGAGVVVTSPAALGLCLPVILIR